MSGLFYYLMTFVESITSIFGLRFAYEQPHYTVLQDLGRSVEIRRYEPRTAIEAVVDDPDRQKAAGEAFNLLFRYITGANQGGQKIAMTVPVRVEGERIAMTAPVQTDAAGAAVSMRFFLPQSVAAAGAPAPQDPRLHLVQVPQTVIAALRFSCVATQTARDRQATVLLSVLGGTTWRPMGPVFQLSYDPPFTIPFLRRNEVAVTVGAGSG